MKTFHEDLLHIPKGVLRKLQPSYCSLAIRLAGQPIAEIWSRHKIGNIRTTSEEALKKSYGMNPQLFWWVNSRNEWFVWHLVPKILHKRIPNRPLEVIDLGCAIGSSTKVLATFLPVGSHVLGIDFSTELLEYARTRKEQGEFTHFSKSPADVDFVWGSVTDVWSVSGNSIDLVTSFGVVGHHLREPQLEKLADEASRVLKPQGWIALDVGPTLSAEQIRKILELKGFRFVERIYAHPLDWRGQVVFQKDLSF